MTVGSALLEMFKVVDPFIFFIVIAALGFFGALFLPAKDGAGADESLTRRKLVYVFGLASLVIGVIFIIPLIQGEITDEVYSLNTMVFLLVGAMLMVENKRRARRPDAYGAPADAHAGECGGAGDYARDSYYPGEVVQAQMAGGEPEHGASAIAYGHTAHPDDHMPRPKPRAMVAKPMPAPAAEKRRALVSAEPAAAPRKASVELAPAEERVPVDYMGCPQCGTTFPIFTMQRPLKIECPSCGIKGVIK